MNRLDIDLMEYGSDVIAQTGWVSDGTHATINYPEINQDDRRFLRYIDGNDYKEGQTFLGVSGYLDSCKFYLKKVGSPIGNIWATLYATTGGVPTGSTISTSEVINALSISNSSYVLQEFIFTSPYLLEEGITYAIVIEGDYSLSSSNYIMVGSDASSSSYTDGSMYHYDGATWNNENLDLIFYIYITLSPPILQCYSESSIKMEGDYSLKIVAKAFESVDSILTKTLSPNIDLTKYGNSIFWARALRTTANFQIGLESGESLIWENVFINASNTWQKIEINLLKYPIGDRNNISKIKIKITNADADNTIYLDDFYAESKRKKQFIVL
jgi:hypothetical protein